MSQHETKYCPRCKLSFECNQNNIAQCQCYGIRLTDDQKAFIELRYKDCLCNGCLTAVKNDIALFKDIYIPR